MNCLRWKPFRPTVGGKLQAVLRRMGPLILLLLPLASCNIIINIHTSNSSSTSSVDFRGTDSSIISDNEQKTFGITDEVLKNAAQRYSGGRPQDVFLHSPTPWNDLYQTYGWREVKRILRPAKSRILDARSHNVILSLKHFDNNSTFKARFDGGLVAEVEDFIENKWNKAGVLDIKQPIAYNINGNINMAYTSSWGANAIKSKKVSIGPNSGVEIILDPGQAVTAVLIASKVTMTVQIDYEASLSGHVACNYPKKYNGHHFWRYEVNALLGAGSLIRTINSAEVISIQFYTDANIVVMDKKTNAKISEFPAVVKST